LTRCAIFTAILLSAATALPLHAAEKVLQNESLESFEGRLTGVEIIEGEIYASRFEAAPGDYPIRLKAVRFVMVGNGAEDARCGAFTIAVWRDGGTTEAGELIFDTEKLGDIEAGGTVAVIKANPSAMQELPLEGELGDVTLNPIEIPSGAFRVGLRYAGECPAELSPAPILIHDATGGAAVHSYLYGAAPGQPSQWLSTSALAMGEWVLRVVVETSGPGEPADAGAGGDAGAASTDPGGATTDPGTSTADAGGAGDTPSPGDSTAQTGDVDWGSAVNDDIGAGDTVPWDGAPKITGIEPSQITAGVATDISIQGRGFAADAEVSLTPGAHSLPVKSSRPYVIDATVPANVPAGIYGVIVANPGGGDAFAAAALRVVEERGSSSGSCAVGSAGGGAAVPALIALLLCLALARRRAGEEL